MYNYKYYYFKIYEDEGMSVLALSTQRGVYNYPYGPIKYIRYTNRKNDLYYGAISKVCNINYSFSILISPTRSDFLIFKRPTYQQSYVKWKEYDLSDTNELFLNIESFKPSNSNRCVIKSRVSNRI